ncbi:MAG: hypothetical protein QXO53_05615, partial [Fervidicoccaceae archaeon]
FTEAAMKRLRSSKIIPEELSEFEKKRISEILTKALVWVERIAPEQIKYSISPAIPSEVRSALKFRDSLIELGKRIISLENWSEDAIKEAMINHTSNMSVDERKEFYREFYIVMLGKESGPRAAPLLSALGKEIVKKKLLEELESN